MARIVSLLARGAAAAASPSSRGAAVAASRSSRKASPAASRSCRAAPTAAGNVAGGSCLIAPRLPRRDLSDDVSGKGGAPCLPAIHSGDCRADVPPNLHMGTRYELEMRWADMMRKAKACLKVDEKVVGSDEALWALYDRWCKFYEIERDHDEMARRFNRFKQNAQLVYKVNNSDVPYNLGLNQFADLNPDELPVMRGSPCRARCHP